MAKTEIKLKRKWGRWVVGVLLAMLLVVAGGHWIAGERAEKRLNARIAELKRAGEPMELADFIDAPVPEADNAAVDLKAGGAAMDARGDTSEAYKVVGALEFDPRLPLTDRERVLLVKWVGENEDALAKLRSARGKPKVAWNVKFTSPLMFMLLPELNPQRELANLAGYEAMLAHGRGDDAAALERIRDILFQSRALERHPTLIGHLVAVGVSALAVDKLEMIMPGVKIGDAQGATSASQVRALVAEMLDERAILDGQRRAFRFERLAHLDAMRLSERGEGGIFGGGGGKTASPVDDATRRKWKATGYALRPMLLGNAELAVRHTTELLRVGDAAADWPTFDKSVRDVPAEAEKNPRTYMFTGMLMPALKTAAERGYRVRAERRMAAVALAIRLYELDHAGRRPSTLDELVPGYLPAVPRDPFAADGRPIGYRAAGERPVLISVGLNGTSEDGSDAPTVKQKCNIGRWQREDALFDLTLRLRPPVVNDAVDDETIEE